MTLLERIKVLREANGNISINKLEKEAGLTRGSMSKWDDHAPSYEKIKKVADYFNVPVSYLTGEEQKESLAVKNGEVDETTYRLFKFWESASDAERKMMLDMADFIKSKRMRE